MMDQGDLSDQLSLVQQMVMEMKSGFSTAMEELAKIQYGDQTIHKQLADNKNQCAEEINCVKQSFIDLKNGIEKLTRQIEEVTDTHRILQEKMDAYQSDKAILLDELERNGAITGQVRMRLGGILQENKNKTDKLTEVAPMVHPYLNSLQDHQSIIDDQYNSDSSLTAAVSRSLTLTQALGEKCIQLDMLSSTSDDEEENSQQSHSGTQRKSTKCFQRKEAARDIIEAEREYCSQLGSLLEDYLNPLQDEAIVNLGEINIQHIYDQHCVMLHKMEKRLNKWKFASVVGDVFARFTEIQDDTGLNMYKNYINDFPTVISTMNKWFAHSTHLRMHMQSQSLANSPILPALLSPLQQVPKYSLLLKNLLKHTPFDHPDRYYIESSLSRLKSFLYTMNSDIEQAMQTINFNSQSVIRSRDSARSRSSGSSLENNHMSRDSGVHSNEDERAKSPTSPNTTRRFVLQVLRERREQETDHSHAKVHQRPQSPSGLFGSHPNLSNQLNGVPNGRLSPYMAPLSQSKMFSSLSKLPLPKKNGKHSNSSDLHEAPRQVINTNYLRPLTPHLFSLSKSTYTFDASRRREELTDQARCRPASAMDFTTSSIDNVDYCLDPIASQVGLTFSSSHTTSSDHSRRELELSLQKLLLETKNANTSFTDDRVREEEPDSNSCGTYQRQFFEESICRRGSDGDEGQTQQHYFGDLGSVHKVKRKLPYNLYTEQQTARDDYGIYGDDDDDDNEHCGHEKVKPMKLLPDTHRPKIIVPRWRQNALPQTPTYPQKMKQISKTQQGLTSEENLAASLAQSLLDGEKNQPPHGEKVPKQAKHSSRNLNNLNRKNQAKNAQAQTQQSPPRETINTDPHGCSQFFDLPLNRPKDFNTTHSHTKESAKEILSSRDTLTSVSKLTDVIAYTTDCLEKSESLHITNNKDNEIQGRYQSSKSLPATPLSHERMLSIKDQVYPSSNINEMKSCHARLSDILPDNIIKVSPIDESDPSSGLVTSTSESTQNIPDFFFALSNSNSENKTNTDGLVKYFRNREQINNTTAIFPITDPNSKVPTYVQLEKTSSPMSEEKYFSHEYGKESPLMLQKHGIGRAIREDFDKSAKSIESGMDTQNKNDQVGQATKESVLQKVDKLRMSFERQKQLSEERRQQSLLQSPTKEVKRPSAAPFIQRQFNEISLANRQSGETVYSLTYNKPLGQKTISVSNTNSHDRSDKQCDSHDNNFSDSSDQKNGMFGKAVQLRSPSRYPNDATSGTKLKIAGTTSPTGRTPSPTSCIYKYNKLKSRVESLNLPGHIVLSNNSSSKDSSLISQKSKSPIHSSSERPNSTTDLENIAASDRDAEDDENSTLKSALKESSTKIPVLKKPQTSKSNEDVSRIKRKSVFKTKLNNIFGRKNQAQSSVGSDED